MAGQWASGARTGEAGPRAASNAEQRDSGARWKKVEEGALTGGAARSVAEQANAVRASSADRWARGCRERAGRRPAHCAGGRLTAAARWAKDGRGPRARR